MEKYPSLILLVSKPFGITSFKFTEQVKRVMKAKKAGHTGTLDPMATGLMVIALNDATRFIPYLNTDTKEYIIQVRFGVETDTGDISGEPVRKSEKIPSASEIQEKIPAFLGEIEQIPPVFSAKKVNGTPMYKLIRSGEKVEAKPAKVKIYEIEVKSYKKLHNEGNLVLRVLCSKGTYMRALARDLGRALGSAATLSAICRTKVGRFSIEDATYISCLKAGKTKGVVPLKDALDFPILQLRETGAVKAGGVNGGGVNTGAVNAGAVNAGVQKSPVEAFLNGMNLPVGHISVIDEQGHFLGVARIVSETVKPEKVRPAKNIYGDKSSKGSGGKRSGGVKSGGVK